ncbi:phosphodiester glycosidase family protein [Roseisolibacter agri]|nr:phosphodiester glycosidase family protein [Roseisolibacter agri]
MHASRLALAHPAPRAVAAGTAILVAAACAPRATTGSAPLPPLRLAATADSATSTTVAPGVVHHRLWFARGPQAVHVLDVDRAACWTLAARKAGGAAVGRAGTLALVRGLADSGGVAVAGGVNADFFLFAPPGVPQGAHVQDGRVIAGPSARPALALDSAGAPWMGMLRTTGSVALPDTTLALDGWNRGSAAGVGVFDAAWGARTDSLPGRVFVAARPLASGGAVVTAVDSGAHAAIPADGIVLAAGARSPARARLAALQAGRDTVRVTHSLGPVSPRQAVGGLPVLLRGGAIDPQVDSAGNAGFRGPNPRTAVGVGANGRRLFLVTVDGRQAGYSLGTTLRETAELLRLLGATDGINLDGGGSTTVVVREAAGGFRIANQPSDSAGERLVANALVVTRGGCTSR